MRATALRRTFPVWVVFLATVLLLATAGTASAADQWTDISDARWVSDYGLTAGEAFGVAEGYSDGSFHPYEDVFRGQFAKMAVSGLGVPEYAPGVPTFKDVGSSHIFFSYVEGAVREELVTGFADDTFRPYTTIFRQQANSVLGRYLSGVELEARGVIEGDVKSYSSLSAWYAAESHFYLGGFTDVSQVYSVHRPATAYLIYRGVVKGSNFQLKPEDSLSRAQAVAMVVRVAQSAEELSDTTAPAAPTQADTIPQGPSSNPRPYVTGETIAGGRVSVSDTFAGSTTEVAEGTANVVGSFSVRVPALEEGEHSFTVRVRDAQDLVSAPSDAVTYLFDETAPTGDITVPADGAAVVDRTPVFQAEAEDAGGSGVADVSFQYRRAGTSSNYVISTDHTAPYQADWNDISLSDDSYDFRVRITDEAGNVATVGPVEVTVDLKAPSATIDSPVADGSHCTTDGSPVFTALATDDPATAGKASSGVVRVYFLYALTADLPADSGDWVADDFTVLSSDDSPGYAADWSGDLADGAYIFAVQAVDGAGNVSDLTTQAVTIDNEAPVVEFTAPTAGDTLVEQTDYTIIWTTDDVSAVDEVYMEYSPTGVNPWTSITGVTDETVNNTGSYVWSVPSWSANTDTFKIRLTATDAAGPALGDVAGHTTVVTSDAFTVQALPNPATALVASDTDYTVNKIDGRDFHLEWEPSDSTDTYVDAQYQDIYILPAGDTLNLSTHNPAASFTDNTTNSWTGTSDVTTDAAVDAFDPNVDYKLYVVTTDDDGDSSVSEGADWTSGTPLAVSELNVVDDDTTNAGVDGWDFSVNWTVSGSPDVIKQEIYILPGDTDLTTGSTLAVSFTDNTTSSWTGTAGLTKDATGDDLTDSATYDVYVVPWSDNGLANTSGSVDVTVNAL